MAAQNSSQSDWIREAINAHQGPLMRYATRLTRDVESVRDVVQDTFLRLCKQPQEKLEGHVAEWLFTVCRNRAFEIMRKEKRMNPLSETHLATCCSAEPTPSDALNHQDKRSEMLRLLGDLPNKQQEVIRLKFQNGLSYKEIHSITNLSISNIGYLIHTGIQTMRRQRQGVGQ